MKRIAVAVFLLLSLTGSAFASDAAKTGGAPKTSVQQTKKAKRQAKTQASSKQAKAKAKARAATSAALSPAGKRAVAAMAARTGLRMPPATDEAADNGNGPPSDLRGVRPVISPQLRHVHPIPPPKRGDDDDGGHPEPIRPAPLTDNSPDLSVQQTAPGALTSAPTSTGLGWDGVGVGLGNFAPSSNPPDVNGRVGATQYVQWNNTSFAVFDKTNGALLYGPAAGNTLFQSLGGVCASHNDGDPVVSYDILAGRWVLSQFVVGGPAGSYSHQCIAVSLTGDATGAYYLYDFLTDSTNFVDYPHMGVWPDGYYMSGHVFNAAGTSTVAARIYVFERTAMLSGQTARMQSKDLPKDGSGFQYGFLPADLDSITPPPAGAQEYVIGPNAQFTNRTDISRVAVTWGTTPTMTLTSTTNTTVGVGTAPCVSNTSAQQNRDCVPQAGANLGANVPADDLDNLGRHYLHRLAYMNHNGIESILATGVTNGATTTPAHGAIKWMEWRGASGSSAPTLFQSGTYDPTSTQSDYRWMPSIAMDKDGNIAIGYSKSSNTTRPGIWMTGRLSTDTVNTMGAETVVQAGGGVQTSGAGNRWGDYTSMTLDPIDQCTFYYTNEYLKTDGAFNWSTRIAAFKFPSCVAAASWGTVTGTITSLATGAPISGVTVNLTNGFAGTSNASGVYSIVVPAGNYTATVSGSDRSCNTASPASSDIVLTSGGTVTQNFQMTGTSNLQFNSFAIDDSANGNANGVINANECSLLNVTLKNNGCATETAIAATLTTSTAGVTITQGTASYPNMLIDGSGANTVPFKFQTSSSFVCGTAINFTLSMTYASGSKSIGFTVPTCSGGPNQSIPTYQLTTSDLSQTDREGRTGTASTCAGKAAPGGGFTGTHYYKTWTFTNSGGSAACITVTINAALGGPGDIESVAYDQTYNPASIDTNYLGDTGISGLGTTVGSASYSFSVPAGHNFVIVVNQTGTTLSGSLASSSFSGTVSGFFDFTQGPGACPSCVPPATPTISAGGATTFCSGGSVTLTSSSATGNQWYLNGSAINAATSNTYVATASGNYTVTATANNCTSPQSAVTTVTVNSVATPTISAGGPTTFCTGGSVTLTSSSATGNQWYLNGSPIGAATSNTYSATASGNYTVVVTANGCTSTASAATTVTVNPIPSTPTISGGGPTTFCAGGSVTLTSSSATGNQWYLNGSPIGAATSNTYNATASGNYTVVVTSNGCSSAASSATSVTVNPVPSTPTISAGGPTTFCTGGSVTLTSSSATGNQWYLNGSPIGAATSNTYNATASGNYTVVVTSNGCSSAASSATTVTVNPIPSTPTINAGGPTTFCAGGSVTLTSSSATGNQWYLNGSPIGAATANTYNATASGNYTVVVTASGCSSAASSATSVTVNPVPSTPTISAGGPTTFCTGGSVTLTSSSATGNQWYLNGSPIGAATSNTYNATASGNYTVVVTSNGCSSAASAATTVTVNPIPSTPTISAGGPTTFCAGGSVTLTSSSATGNQWYLNGSPIGAATSNTYNATASGNYTVVVTSNGCSSAASSATSVAVNPVPATPTINAGGPTTFCAGGSVTLTSSSATGNQWYLDGSPINSAISDTYNATASGNYTVVVTANGCPSAASAATTVTVNPIPATPTINAAGPTTICAGGSVMLTSSSATGNQWYLDGSPINSATSNTYNATASGNYTVVVTTNGCSSAASAATTVTVNPAPATPTINPGGPTTFCAGGSVTLTSSSATGNQWYLDGSPIGAATSNTYNATASGNYTVVVTTNGCTSTASAATTVTVNPIPSTPTINAGGPTTFCTGGSVTLTSSSAAGNQWYLNGSPIGAATSNTYNATASGNYTVVVTTNGCSSSASAATAVTVNPIPSTPTINAGGPTTFCAGGGVTLTSSSATGNQWYLNGSPIGAATSNTYNATASGNYTVVVTASGCSSAASSATSVTVNPVPATPTINAGGPTTFCTGGSVTLTSSSATGNQWYLDGWPINAATSNTFNATASGNYTVVVTSSGCTSAASAATTVTVNPIPSTPTINAGGPTTFCAGGSVTLTSSSATGNQWYLDGSPINAATSNTFNATASGNYTVVVTTNGCASAASAATTVTVNPTPSTPTINAGSATTFCAGGSVTLTSSSATGNQWYLNGSPIGAATSNTYNATATGNYTVVVTTNGCASAASAATTVTVNPTPSTPTINAGSSTTFCAGGSVTLTSSSATGNQWYLDGSPIGAATSNTYNATASGNYTVVVTTNGCSSSTSAATTVTVNPIPSTPTINAGGPTTFCTGGSVTLTSSTATGNQWYLNGSPINAATSSTYNATGSGNYTVVVTSNGCTSAASAATTVTVNPIPSTPTINAGGPTTFCAGGSVTLTSSSATGNQWYLDGSPINLATSNTFNATAAGNYTVIVTASGCASSASAATTVTVNPTPSTPTINAGGPTTFCAGGSVTLTSSSTTGNQWYLDGNAINAATSNTYNATGSGSYTVVVTSNGCASSTSAATSVTVNPVPAVPTITPSGTVTFCSNSTATLTSSSATGNQWYAEGSLISGATGQTLVVDKNLIAAYSQNFAAHFTVVVTSAGCSSTSSAKLVEVLGSPAPTIVAQGPTTFCDTSSVTLEVDGAGPWQWYRDGALIDGATGSTYVATVAGSYTAVEAFYSQCPSDPSNAIVVVVNPTPATPTINAGGPTTFCTGGSVTLTSSSATGNQWYLNGSPIGAATSNTYNATAAGNYTVTVTSSGCTSAASAATTVTVNPIPSTPTINAGSATTFCTGGSVTLTSSSATGNQWYLNGSPINAATSNTYNATASGNYTVVVTTNGCSSAASAATTVTVNPIPSTPTINAGGATTFCTGGSVTLTSSSATGNQWYLNGSPIGAATSNTYNATASGNYTVVVTTSGCSSAASAATTVTVNPIPSTPTINAGGATTFCTGGSVTLTSSSATGNQWYLNGSPIGAATSNTYNATASGNYTVVVTTSGCASAASAATTVTVNPIPSTPTINAGSATTFCAGGSVTLTSSSASGNQWYLNGSPIGAATSNTYNATASGNYTVVVTTSGCTSAASAATTVTVNPTPATPTISAGSATTFCTGGSVTLTSSSATGNQWYLNGSPINAATSNTYNATASGSYTVVVTSNGCSSSASAATAVTVNPIPSTPTINAGSATTFCTGGSVTLTSSSATGNQWYLNGSPINAATSNTYNATASGNYTVVVTASGCSSAASAATTVTVNPIPSTPTISAGSATTFCAGGSVTLTSSSATGNQWYLNGSPINAATSNTYNATSSGNYTVVVTNNGCPSSASTATSVTVNPTPATPTINAGSSTTFCAGGSVTLTSSSATGNQWYANGAPISGANGNTYIASTAGDYSVVVTSSGCTSSASSATHVAVNPIPNATITVVSTITAATSASASVANAGNGATYQWSITNGVITGGAGTSSITFAAGTAGTVTLNVTVTNAGCSDTKSANIAVTAAVPSITVTAVSPGHGPFIGGTPITITGTGFVSGATVTIGGTAATNVVVVDATKITAVTPAHAPGTVDVTVTNPNTKFATLSGGFVVVPQQFDANGDNVIDPADIFYLINYLFTGGPAPNGAAGMVSGDANGDGVVDPADIFYLVNYLFTGGPQPMSTNPSRGTTMSVRSTISGSVRLGAPKYRVGHAFVPVIVTSTGATAPDALALQLRVEGAADAKIHRLAAGSPSFEITRTGNGTLSYLLSFDGRTNTLLGGAQSAVVAEIEVETAGDAKLAIDPSLTMLTDAGGTRKATAAAGTLELSGATLDIRERRPAAAPRVNEQ